MSTPISPVGNNQYPLSEGLSGSLQTIGTLLDYASSHAEQYYTISSNQIVRDTSRPHDRPTIEYHSGLTDPLKSSYLNIIDSTDGFNT